MKRTILVALVLACGAAQASEWVSLGKTTDGKTEYLADVSSIQSSGVITRAWIKLLFAPHTQQLPAEDSKKKKWAMYSVERFAYMCAEGDAELEAMSVYFEDGTFMAAPAEVMVGATFEPVPPDTIGDTVMKYVCAWKPTTQTGASTSRTEAPTSQTAEQHSSDVERSTPEQGAKTILMPGCGDDYYPSQEKRQGHHGSAVVRVCIGIDNKIDGPVELISSSGFPSLDEAAAKCMAAGRYRAGTLNGAPARACKDFKVTFWSDK